MLQKAVKEVKECVASGVTPEGLTAKVPEQEKGGGGKGRRKRKGGEEEKGGEGEEGKGEGGKGEEGKGEGGKGEGGKGEGGKGEGGKGEGGDDQKTGKEDSSEQQVIFFTYLYFLEGLFLLLAVLTQEKPGDVK